MTNEKLYVILDKYLPAGLKMAQGIHAANTFADRYRSTYDAWFQESNNIVVLEATNLPKLLAKLIIDGHEVSEFTEPDLDDRLTAICAAPSAKKKLASLKLAA